MAATVSTDSRAHPGGRFRGASAHLMGYETVLVAYFEAPDLAHGIASILADLLIVICEKAPSQRDVDAEPIWEDVPLGRGSKGSEQVIREFQMPCYDAITSQTPPPGD